MLKLNEGAESQLGQMKTYYFHSCTGRYRGGLRKVGGLELKKNFVLTTHMIKSFVIISTSATMKLNFKITELLA